MQCRENSQEKRGEYTFNDNWWIQWTAGRNENL